MERYPLYSGHYRAQSLQEVFSAEKLEANKEISESVDNRWASLKHSLPRICIFVESSGW